VAGLGAHAETVDGLVEEADRALYRAKQLGKNQVAVA
jgi:PleD family two-component response regulator